MSKATRKKTKKQQKQWPKLWQSRHKAELKMDDYSASNIHHIKIISYEP
jgi:hypothetical protein